MRHVCHVVGICIIIKAELELTNLILNSEYFCLPIQLSRVGMTEIRLIFFFFLSLFFITWTDGRRAR